MTRITKFFQVFAAFIGLGLLTATLHDTAAQTAGVLASAQYSADPDLRCDLLEVKRVSGGSLMIRWLVANTSAKSGGLTGAGGKTVRYTFRWDDVYFIDPAENKKYQFLTDSGGNRILDIFEGDLAPGEQRLNWARFPAPPESSSKISFGIPKCSPPFDDIAIAR
jgi:hypothetical protein